MSIARSTRVLQFKRSCFSLALGAMLPTTLVLAAPPLPEALPADAPVDLKIESLIDEFENRDARAAKARREAISVQRRADIERLGTEPSEAALAFGRRAVAADPTHYRLRLRLIGMLHQAGYSDEADQACAAILAEAPTADNAVPRQRAMLKRARIAYDRRDLTLARYWLGELASSGNAGLFTEDLEQVGSRIERVERRQAMQAALDRLGTEPTPEALAYGRAAIEQDPSNLNLRTRMVGLLARAGLAGEADRLAADFATDPLTQSAPYKRREMLLERARIALARGDADAAERFADQATALPLDIAEQSLATAQAGTSAMPPAGDALDAEPPIAEAAVVEDPEQEQRILRKQRQVRIGVRIARIGNVPTADAIAAARTLHESEPDSGDAAFHYATMLRATQDYGQAETVYRSFRSTVPAEDVEMLARVDERLDSLRVAAEIDRIGDVPTSEALAAAQALRQARPGSSDAAFHHAALLRANRDFAGATTVLSEFRDQVPSTNPELVARVDSRLASLQVAADLDRIGLEPTRAALAEAQALHQREPQSADIGMHYAQMLRKNRDFAEAVTVYRDVAAGPGATDPEVATRAQLGIAEVYLAQGRAREASLVVASLNAAPLSPNTISRVDLLDNRIDDRMPAPGLTGNILVSAGYDTNAISRTNLLDQGELDSFEEVESPFQSVDAAATYRQPLGLDGHYLALGVHGEYTTYNDKEASGVDRTVLDATIAPTFSLPQYDLLLTTGVGFRNRERDNAFSRRTTSAFVRADTYTSMRMRVSAAYIFETSEDVRSERDGTAHELGLRARYAVTERGRVLAEARVRAENADADYESRQVYTALLGYRHDVPALLSRPLYWQTNVVVDHVRYDEADPNNADTTSARRDDNLRFDGVLGVLLTPRWTAELRASQLARSSTNSRYDGDSTRVTATVRYDFGGR